MKLSLRIVSWGVGLVAVSVALAVGEAWGQAETQAAPRSQSTERAPSTDPMKTFYLKNTTQLNDPNEIQTGLRLMLEPRTKIYLVQSQNAIVIRGTPDQFVLAQQLLDEIDRPKGTYRLTYTINESEAGKRIGAQHFALVLVPGQRTTLKQGSKVPIVTGSYEAGTASQNQQVTYLDIGMNFDATLNVVGQTVTLRSKVEQSSVAPEKSGFGSQDPVVRQSVLEGTAVLALGKTLVLGSLDTPGSTRHLDVEVVLELVK